MNKEARLNLLFFGIFVIVIMSMFMFGFVNAFQTSILGSDESKVVNYSLINTVVTGVGGGDSGLVNEDMGNVYNISINNSLATGDRQYNITSVNISLWGNFDLSLNLYDVLTGSNGTGNLSGRDEEDTGTVLFSNTTDNGITLSWNSSGNTGLAIIRGDNMSSNSSFFWFNATAVTPGKYNITVRVTYNQSDGNGVLVYNETNITVVINDTTAPHIVNVTGGHTFGLNRSYANVSGTITVNISAWDNGNLTAGAREYDVQTVNISFFNGSDVNASYLASNVSGYYWNVSIDTTTLNDGVYNVTVIVNDTQGNVNITNISNLRVDNTVPTATVSCTPATVNTGDVVTCTCSPSDSLSGVNTTATSIVANPSTDNTGTHTETCSYSDMAGNTASASGTYTVELSASGGTSSGGTTTTTTFTYSKTIPQTSADFSEIKTIETSSFGGGGLKAKERVKIKLNEEEHYIGVKELTETSATIEITSDPVQVKLDIGQDAKVDLNDNNFYDVHVKLNGIVGGVADLTIIYLHEEIPEGEGAVSTTGDDLTTGGEEGEISKEGASLTWLWILIGVILLVIMGLVLKKKKQ